MWPCVTLTQNLKSRSHDLDHAPFGQYFIFSFIIPYGQSARKIWGLYLHRSRDIRGSWNLKSRSIDLGHAPFWPIFHLGYWFSILTINPHAKFEVCIFSRSRDIRGSQNLKSRSRDHSYASFWPIFSIFRSVSLTVDVLAKFEVCIFSRPRDIRNLKIWKVGHVTQATPLLTYFSFFV